MLIILITCLRMSSQHEPTLQNYKLKIYNSIIYASKSTIGRLLLTFLSLHTMHYIAACIYAKWCLDMSFFGFFTNIINSHGPVCHALMLIAYHAQQNIYTLIGTAAIGAGITWITDFIYPIKYKDN